VEKQIQISGIWNVRRFNDGLMTCPYIRPLMQFLQLQKWHPAILISLQIVSTRHWADASMAAQAPLQP